MEPDALVEMRLLTIVEGGRQKGIGRHIYRPTYLIKPDYLTSTDHFLIDCEWLELGSTCQAYVKFITPEHYPKTLFIGRVIPIQEGSKIVGHSKILEIYNEILNRDSNH